MVRKTTSETSEREFMERPREKENARTDERAG
jgi:hypothetical protein